MSLKEIEKRISDLVKEGWQIKGQYLTGPSGFVYDTEKLRENLCCICSESYFTEGDDEFNTGFCQGFHTDEEINEHGRAYNLFELLRRKDTVRMLKAIFEDK